MRRRGITAPEIFERLEAFYGGQEPCWPTDPYLFLVWWHCGYPASDAACARGWESLNGNIGVEPHQLLAASTKQLASALAPGGMVPELRALRLKEIAARVQELVPKARIIVGHGQMSEGELEKIMLAFVRRAGEKGLVSPR